MDGGWAYFIRHGRISRLDVAVDFPDVEMDQFHFLPKQAATVKKWAVDGKLQTYQHGQPKGNHTSIYNRKAKRIAQKKPWLGKEGIRIERRLINLGLALKALPSLSNPFIGMAMVRRSVGRPSTVPKPYLWKYFMIAAEDIGLAAALAWLPDDMRTVFRNHFKLHGVGWWDVDALWKGWPAMLSQLKIADIHAWH